MDDTNNDNRQQGPAPQQQTDSAGNQLRGRGGDLIGVDRGPVRGGNFESLHTVRTLEASPHGASSSVEGWVLMLSNLSPAATENDIRLLLSDVDPTSDLMSGGQSNNESNNNNNNNALFISDLRINPGAATCGCVGHAFVKVPRLEWAYLVQKLNGRDFVDDMPIKVDFVFAVPEPEMALQDGSSTIAAGGNGTGRHDRGAEYQDAGPAKPVRADD